MNCAFDSIPSFFVRLLFLFFVRVRSISSQHSLCHRSHSLSTPSLICCQCPAKKAQWSSPAMMFRRAKSTFVFSFTFHLHTSQQRAASEWLMVWAEIWWNFWWFKSQLISHSFYFITFSVCVSISKCNISSSPLSLRFSRHPWHIFIKSSISSQLSFLLFFYVS